MLKQFTLSVAALSVAGMLTVSSCKKEAIEKKVAEPAFDRMELAKVSNQLVALVWGSGNASLSFKNSSLDCAVITVDSLSSPQTTTYDFGEGCTDENGVVRKGIMIATYNRTDIRQPGTVCTITFSDFYLNNDQVKGELSVENIGLNSNGNLVVRYDGNCQDISPVNGEVQMDIKQEFEWMEGSSTQDNTDDVFDITGFIKATAPSGNSSEVSVVEPLKSICRPGCNQYFVKGVTLTQTTGEYDRYLDYGNGDCDAIATQTVDGQSTTITLE